MRNFFNYVLQGVLFIAPLGITLYIIYYVFTELDSVLQERLSTIVDFKIPGLGFIALILVLALIGFLGNTIIAKPLTSLFKKVVNRIPVLNFIFNAFNDLFSAFVGKEKKFNKPVLVKVNLQTDLEKLGFITEDNLAVLDESDKVAVYFPHSYNFSGELFIVPKENVRRLDIESSEVMKFIVSAGLVKWSKKNLKKDLLNN